MTSNILLVICALFSLWNIADANTQESLELRVFDRDVQISDDEMMEMLKTADLKSHGYETEIISQLVSSDTGNAKSVYEKRFQFLKTIECSRMREIDQELNRLIPGIFGMDVVKRINKEIRTKSLDGFTKCRAGLEVHLKNSRSCGDSRVSKRRKRAGCGWCVICFVSKLS